jgi:hypothetical protein
MGRRQAQPDFCIGPHAFDLDFASQSRYIGPMKTATLPSIRVEPEFRATVESVLHVSESLTEFVENAVRETVVRRRNQAEFVARGMLSLEEARHTGQYVDADVVVDKLREKLSTAKRRVAIDKKKK